MSCEVTCAETQTEFEFFQQMINSDSQACCGPITLIGFTSSSLTSVIQGLIRQGVPLDYLDNYRSQVLDSSHIGFAMCSKHWVSITSKLGVAGAESNNDIWLQLSFYMFRVLCLTNGWDHKEIINYLKTFRSLDKPY